MFRQLRNYFLKSMSKSVFDSMISPWYTISVSFFLPVCQLCFVYLLTVCEIVYALQKKREQQATFNKID